MSYANKRRQSGGDDEGGGANWMDTYGDLVTLLLCFFVLLFAFSSMDSAKWEALVAALGGSPMTISSTSIDMTATIVNPVQDLPKTKGKSTEQGSLPEIPEEFDSAEEVFFELYTRLDAFVNEHNMAASVEADFEALVLVLRFDDSIFFNSGEAELLPESIPLLDKMVGFFEENDKLYQMIIIEGHTDNVPITGRYRNNWVLSAARSTEALCYMVDSGRIDDLKILQQGLGEKHPIATNETEEGRALNRRVDFVIQGLKSE